MATTNIASARLLNGMPVKESDLRPGLRIEYPAPTGGVLTYRCTSVSEESARFKSEVKDWPFSFEMKFNIEQFTLQEFEELSSALSAFNSWRTAPTDHQRKMVIRAHELGYATQISFTQASWTDAGIKKYLELRSVN